jgi:hypothetical protein
MALSRGTAAAIVQAVTRDPESRKVIDSPLEYIGGTGWAGGFRNTGMILGNALSIFGGHIAAGQLARVGDFQGATAVTEDTRRTYGTLGSINLTPEQAAQVSAPASRPSPPRPSRLPPPRPPLAPASSWSPAATARTAWAPPSPIPPPWCG